MTAPVLLGALGGAGVVALIAAALMRQPDLRGALARLNPERAELLRQRALPQDTERSVEARLGTIVDRLAGRRLPIRVPDSELALVGISRERFIGEKTGLALIGLVFPNLVGLIAVALDAPPPPGVPVLASLAIAAALFFVPDVEVRRKAAAAREEFSHAVVAYLDLVALERAAGSGGAKALESAASVADTWVFARLRQRLARARWAGEMSWAAMDQMSAELQVPELANIADIMRQSGETGAAVYDHLRASAKQMRNAHLSMAQSRAKARLERVALPQAAAALVFLLLLLTPAVLRLLSG